LQPASRWRGGCTSLWRLSKAVSAAGKLNALELALTLGSRDPSDIVKEYQEVLAENESLLH